MTRALTWVLEEFFEVRFRDPSRCADLIRVDVHLGVVRQEHDIVD